MTRQGPKNVGTYLPTAAINRAGVHMDKISNLLAHWKVYVGEPLASHTYPVSYENGLLSVRADTSAWASRVRHSQVEIMKQLRQDPYFLNLAELHVRVLPERAGAPQEKKKTAATVPSRISNDAARIIKSVADDITDPALRKSLNRLAGWQEKQSLLKR